MSLPANVNLVTVTGTYINADGTPCVGTVEFVPGPPKLNNPGADTVIILQTITATLDATGSISTEVLTTDDPDVTPTNWRYRVRVRLTDCQSAFSFDMTAPAGPPINLTDITPTWSE